MALKLYISDIVDRDYEGSIISNINLLYGVGNNTTEITCSSTIVSDISVFWWSSFWQFTFNINGVVFGPYKYQWGEPITGAATTIAAGKFNTNGSQFNTYITQFNNIDYDGNDLTHMFSTFVAGRDSFIAESTTNELKQADLYEDESISLKRKIFGDTGIENSSFTKDFNIPASNKNNKLLKHYELKENISTLNPNKKIEARIEIDNIYTLTGNLELLSVTWKNEQPENYQIVFYSNTSSIKADLGEALLSDLDYTDFNFTWNSTTITDTWAETINSGRNYIPLISWKRWLQFGGASGDINDIAGASTGILLSELRVGLRLIELIQLIGNHINKKFTFDTSINSYLTGQYIIPTKKVDVDAEFSIDGWNTIAESSSVLTVTTAMSNVILDTVIEDEQTNWSSSYIYTPSFSGSYTFTINYVASASENFDIDLYDITGAAVVVSDSYSGANGTFTLTGNLTAGNQYKFQWQILTTTVTATAHMETTAVPVNYFGTDFDAALTMPEVKLVDFLSSFLKAYNLIIYETSPDTYIIKDTINMYKGGDKFDIEPYIDSKILNYKKADVYGLINYKHQTGKDAPNILFNNNAGREFGEFNYRPNIDYSKGDIKIESMFTIFPPGYMSKYDGSGTLLGNTNMRHHYQLSNDAPPKAVLSQFLLLYKNATVTLPGTDQYNIQDSVNADGSPHFAKVTTYSNYSQVQDEVSISSSNTTSYNLENPFIGTIPISTAFNNYFADWLTELYKNTAYTLDISFPINISIFIKLENIGIVYYKGFYHFIKSYQYDTGKQLVTLNLLRYDKV